MEAMGWIDLIAKVLVIIGALNWGLFGIFGMNLVAYLPMALLQTIVYVLVGLSGLWMIYSLYKDYQK